MTTEKKNEKTCRSPHSTGIEFARNTFSKAGQNIPSVIADIMWFFLVDTILNIVWVCYFFFFSFFLSFIGIALFSAAAAVILWPLIFLHVNWDSVKRFPFSSWHFFFFLHIYMHALHRICKQTTEQRKVPEMKQKWKKKCTLLFTRLNLGYIRYVIKVIQM